MTGLADAMPFARMIGLAVTEATSDRVVGTLEVTEDHCTAGGILHGGAAMAMGDSLGAIGAFLSLPEGAGGTTTIESKTNFIGSAPVGDTVTGEATPVHIGRRMSVWQTRITRADGKTVAIVTQTQLVLQG